MKTVQEIEEQLGACSFFLRLCSDLRVVDLSDGYIFVGQFLVEKLGKTEAVIAVKSFSRGTSATSEILYSIIVQDSCEDVLSKIYSVMADTTAKNLELTNG